MASEESHADEPRVSSPAQSEREVKTVVSGWVREHRQRAEEFRHAFAVMLREAGFNPSGSASCA